MSAHDPLTERASLFQFLRRRRFSWIDLVLIALIGQVLRAVWGVL